MDDDDAREEIPVGRRLVQARGSSHSLTARLSAYLYRLTWRTPLHRMRLKGRYPLKLLAVPDDALPGDAAGGTAMLGGRVKRMGESAPIGAEAFSAADVSAAFADHVQRFAFLRDLAAAGPRGDAAPVAEAMIRAWLADYGETVTPAGWRPDRWGWRILNWTAHAPLILSSGDLVYRSSVLNALARGARHLDRTAGRAASGAPRIAAWAGLAAAGLLMPGGEGRRAFAEAGLADAIADGVSSDGGVTSRSPAAQIDAILALSMLARTYDARRIDRPDIVAASLQRMVPALLGVRLGDGGLSSWQGSPPESDARVSAIVAASGVRARPLSQAREWGYQRMSAGETVVVVDAAPPPLGPVEGGGCASTLAFELSDGGHRLVVNCGGGNGGGVAASLAQGLRTSAAHSTLILSDTNSTAVLAEGGLGKGVTEVELDRDDHEGEIRIEARHDGYARRFGLGHRRTLILAGDGRELHGEDSLIPARGRRRSTTAGFAVRFHLAPGIEASPTADGQGALLRLDRGPLWQFRCRGGQLSIEDSLWIDADARPQGSKQLVVAGESPPSGAAIDWVFRRAG